MGRWSAKVTGASKRYGLEREFRGSSERPSKSESGVFEFGEKGSKERTYGRFKGGKFKGTTGKAVGRWARAKAGGHLQRKGTKGKKHLSSGFKRYIKSSLASKIKHCKLRGNRKRSMIAAVMFKKGKGKIKKRGKNYQRNLEGGRKFGKLGTPRREFAREVLWGRKHGVSRSGALAAIKGYKETSKAKKKWARSPRSMMTGKGGERIYQRRLD